MARGPVAPQQPQSADMRLTTTEYREFRGMNYTDSRTTIDDNEFEWLENLMPIGKGNLQTVPPRGPAIGTATGVHVSLWGFNLRVGGINTPFLYVVRADGGIHQIHSVTGITTTVCAPGVMSANTRLAVWRDTHILFIDPTKGYAKWDGTIFTIIDAAKTGRGLAVFEGRAWLLSASRSITFTAPNTFDDFTAASGAGVVTITDSAFPGEITELESALQQLWVVGAGAINAISNVVTSGSPLITTFSIVNIVSSIGSAYPYTVTSFLRTFLLLSPIGVYAIVGATPQKLSDKLDRLFPLLRLDTRFDWSAAVGNLFNVFTWMALVVLRDPITGQDRPVLLCFSQGKWFLASQDPGLVFIASLTSTAGRPEVWGTNGTEVFKLFGGEGVVHYRLRTKLYEFGSMAQWNEWLKIGLDFTSDAIMTPEAVCETERVSRVVPLINASTGIVFVGAGPITFVGAAAITFVATGLQLVRQNITPGLIGRYLGLTLDGTSPAWTLSGIAMLTKPMREWT